MVTTTSTATFLEHEHLEFTRQVDEFTQVRIAPFSEEQVDYISQGISFLKELAQEGLLRYVVARPYGGFHPHVDIRSVCLIRQGLARYSALADAMFAMQGLGSYPIYLAGSDNLKRTWLPRVGQPSGKSGRTRGGISCAGPQTGRRPVVCNGHDKSAGLQRVEHGSASRD